MTVTYCTDADVSNHDAQAAGLLPSTDAGSFDRFRIIAQKEIRDRIARRNPPVVYTELSDTTELCESEVRFVLHYVYRDASSRTGEDMLWMKSEYWRTRAEEEVNGVPLSVGTEDVQSQQGYSAPIWRS